MTRTSLVFAVTLATLAAFTLSSSNGIALSGPVSLSNLAPADEYFGRQKLSPIGIRHMVYSLKDELYHARRPSDAIEHDAGIVDDALQDWSSRFPRDSWLPSTFWNLAQLYASLPGVDARTRALGILQQLRDRFPEAPYAAGAAREMPASLVRAVDAVSVAPPNEQSAAALTLEDRFFTLSAGGRPRLRARCLGIGLHVRAASRGIGTNASDTSSRAAGGSLSHRHVRKVGNAGPQTWCRRTLDS